MSSYLNRDFSGFDQQKWETALKNHLNTHIEEFATQMADKTSDDMHLDLDTKTITCGNLILKLSDVLRRSPPGRIDYRCTRALNNKIKHLADCIETKILEETLLRLRDSQTAVDVDMEKPKKRDHDEQGVKRKRESSIPSDNEAVKKARINRENIQALNAKLWHSFLTNDLKSCKEAIMNGANLNMQDMQGNSLLMLALQMNKSAMVDFLIQMKADVNLPNIYRETPLLLAAKNSNVTVSKQLLSCGADPIARDTTLNTPLHYALLNSCHTLFELLVEVTDLNAQNIFKESPLDIAVGKNNLLACQTLIDRGVLLDNKNSLGTTALMHAISYEYLPIVHLLIDKGASLVSYDEVTRSPLMLKGAINNIEIFKKLIDAGCEVGLRDSFGFSVLDYLKSYRSEDYKDRVALLKAKEPQLKEINKEIHSRKLVAHAWDLEGTSSIKDQNQHFSLPLAGGVSEQWAHQMQKNLNQFCKDFPNDIKDPDSFRNTLLTAAGTSFYSIEEKLAMVKQGLPVFFNTGFKEHAVTILIWGDQFIICNRGNYSRTALEFFHFDPNALNLEHLNKMSSVLKAGPEIYQQLFFKELPQQLKFVKTSEDQVFELSGQMSLPFQIVGNCSWASLMGGIYAVLLLSELKKETGPDVMENIKNADTEASEIFENWENFQKIFSFRSLLNHMKESEFEPDSNLLQMVKESAFNSSSPVLTEERNKLIQACEQRIYGTRKKINS